MIDHVAQEVHQVCMYAGITLHEAAEARDHETLGKHGSQAFAGAGAVTADEVVLQLVSVLFGDAVLRHRAKTGIDTVNELF